jgi:hypothetical protein
MKLTDFFRKFLGRTLATPPDITPILEEGKRERIRAAVVLKQLDQERKRQQAITERYATWEELFGNESQR